jgi:hypothetical protein
MSNPRNKVQFAIAQSIRAEIDHLLRTRTQADPLLCPKELARMLNRPCKLRTIQRHVSAIRRK